MANQEQLKIILSGVERWNQWTVDNRTINVDLFGANLSGANLSGADLSGADLSGANLIDADISGAIGL